MPGDLARAEAGYRELVGLDPANAHAQNGLGIALALQGRSQEAQQCFAEAIRLQTDFSQAHNNLGNALKEQGRREEALASYQQAVTLNSDFAEAYNNLGNVQRELGQLDEAIANCRQALRLKPDLADAHNNLAAAYSAQRQWEAAADSCRQAIALHPNHAEAHSNLGNALRQLGRVGEAIASLRHALRLNGDLAETHGWLTMALLQQGDLAGALTSCREVLRLRPNLDSGHLNMGFILSELGRRSEALACYERALELHPDMPEARKNRSRIWLLEGKLAEGWAEFEWRWKCPDLSARAFPQPLWDGSPLDGKTVLLHAEQGFGDTIQFVRYARLVHERGGRVIVACQGALVSLLKRCPGVDQVVAQDGPLPPFEVHVPLMSLPRIFSTTLESIPGDVPYIHGDPRAIARWRAELSGVSELKIGIAWQGNRVHRGDRSRSISLALFAPLAELPGVRLYSLQKNFGQEQLAQAPFRQRVVDLSPRLETFDDTAAVVQNLDLIIACDTSVIHLAGGLGRPTWVALAAVPDWRWLLDRDDSPWYPTLRLFRQRQRGDWPEVFRRITAAVADRMAGAEAGRVRSEIHQTALPASNAPGAGLPGHRRGEASRAGPRIERGSAPATPIYRIVSPNSVPVNFDEARRQHQAGNVEQAVALYRRVLLDDPNNAHAWYLMGVAYVQLGQLDDARASLRQATSVNPWHADAHNHLGVVLAQQAALDDAISSFRRALELKPDNVEAQNNLRLALSRQGEAAEG